jgi:hypothetical protein
MLQFSRMNPFRSLVLYQDEPFYSGILKIILLLVPVIILAASLYLWSTGEGEGSLVLFGEGVFISLLLWAILPRKYQVFEDHLRIVLGGPFSIKIGFGQVTAIEVTTRTALTINFVTRIARTYVRIVRRKGLGIAITPKNNELFVKNAHAALNQWQKNNPY